MELLVSQRHHVARLALENDRRLVAQRPLEMTVEAIVARVDFAPDKPLREWRLPDANFFPRAEQLNSVAILPQNLSGFFSEARCIFWYFFKLPIRAAFANFVGGLKIRFSFRCDSIFVAGLTGEADAAAGSEARVVDMGARSGGRLECRQSANGAPDVSKKSLTGQLKHRAICGLWRTFF